MSEPRRCGVFAHHLVARQSLMSEPRTFGVFAHHLVARQSLMSEPRLTVAATTPDEGSIRLDAIGERLNP